MRSSSLENLRTLLVKTVLSLAFLTGIIMSWRLWTLVRYYPAVPIFDFIPKIQALDLALFLLLMFVICLILIARSVLCQWTIRLLLAVILILIAQDQSRLQPWVYQYVLMFGSLSFLSWNPGADKNTNNVLNTLRTTIILVYFWAGLQKLNPHFSSYMIPLFIRQVAPWFSVPKYFPGIFESSIGLGLLFAQTRPFAILGALIMWLLVLSTIGPIGSGANSVVWPWIIAMAAFTIILFYKTSNISPRQILWPDFPYQRIILILVGLMPFFSFFNKWDSYLSWSLYAGNTKHFNINISSNIKSELPPYIRQFVNSSGRQNSLDVLSWSYNELNVPHYPEDRIIKHVAKYFCSYAQDSNEVKIRLWQDNSLANYDYNLNCSGL